jgi:acetolactate synthase-1/2/3 large subunit
MVFLVLSSDALLFIIPERKRLMALLKVSDYIAQKLVENGISHVFMIPGGGAMHLNDSLGKHPKLTYIVNHHEQACAIAAESYARLTGKIALVNVTSGPGGINALTGVLGGWLDSVPMLIISGQVRFDTTVRSTGLALRQLGDQEYDIVRVVSHMAKYAEMVIDPKKIRYHIEKALFLATSGRPGPCWLDIPLNVQGAMVDEMELSPYDPAENSEETSPDVSNSLVENILTRIQTAKRPVILAGTGIRLAKAHQAFTELISRLNVPVVTAWNAHDVIYDDHPLYFGRPSTVGDRPGNFVVQNSDLLLVLGCRLNLRQIGYFWTSFAREAFKIVVDIDPVELEKPTVKIDLPVHACALTFIRALLQASGSLLFPKKDDWLSWCRIRKEKYPVVQSEYWSLESLVNPYCFMDELSRNLPEGQISVTGNGSACVCAFQAYKIKKGQRLYTNSGSATMGYDLPAAIGACIGSGGQKIVCLAGDGSIMMNLQELQTISYHKFPIKIFVLNNAGFHSMRQTQKNFFGSPLVACGPESGISFPDFEKLSHAFGFPYVRCAKHDEMSGAIQRTMEEDNPAVCEVMLTPDQPFVPKQSSQRLPDGRMVSKPLEDLFPLLDRKEFLENMIIAPLQE